ncbi:MAG TPA: hypothetical protein VFV54_07365 [Thermoanaerobaculia bacterium]|nr:hypothetical protein [Thermoanaerobaculia bacterium]
MRTSRPFIVAIACLLAVSFAAPAAAACKPVVGLFEASVVPPGTGHCPPFPNAFCTAGRVWGGIQGTYQFVMTGAIPASQVTAVPLPPGIENVLFFTGRSAVALLDGSTVEGSDTGSLDLPPGAGGFASLITWDAKGGQIRLRGEFNPAAGTTSGEYIGTLCSE